MKNKWTEQDLEFLKENYNKMTNEQLSKKLKKTKGSIYVKYKTIFSEKQIGFSKKIELEKTISKDLIMYVLSKNKLMTIKECLKEII